VFLAGADVRASLRLAPSQKNSRESEQAKAVVCAKSGPADGGFAFGGVYPAVDGATTGLCMPVQSYGLAVLWIQLQLLFKAPIRRARAIVRAARALLCTLLLPGSTIGRASAGSGFNW
jgi:hypothetical protein